VVNTCENCKYRRGNDNEIIIMWEGYFDQVMRLMLPDEQGWTGLAYYYNMYTGWYEESPNIFLRGEKNVNMCLWKNKKKMY